MPDAAANFTPVALMGGYIVFDSPCLTCWGAVTPVGSVLAHRKGSVRLSSRSRLVMFGRTRLRGYNPANKTDVVQYLKIALGCLLIFSEALFIF